MKKLAAIKISGIHLPLYILMVLIVVIAAALDQLPHSMIGAMIILLLLGNLLNFLGNNIPIMKSYLGGGAVFCIFVSAAIATFGLLPKEIIELVSVFMRNPSVNADGTLNPGMGFLDFYIVALIVGSFLGMDRALLKKAAVKFLPVTFIAMALTVLTIGLVGMLIGYGFNEAIMFVALPLMSGGMGGGIAQLIPLYQDVTGINYSPQLVGTSVLGNLLAILVAIAVVKITEKNPSLNGQGKLLKLSVEEAQREKVEVQKSDTKLDYTRLGVGLVVCLTFLALGGAISYIFKATPGLKDINGLNKMQAIPIMVIIVVIVKISGILPKYYEEAASQWSQFVVKTFTPALMTAIGIAYLPLNELGPVLNVEFFVLCLTSIIAITFFAGLLGRLVNFYPVESAITAGLCTNSMGGTGNLAILSATNRMELISFAQMATRIGGALIVVVAYLLSGVLL